MENRKEFKYIICPQHFAVWQQKDMTGGKWIYLKQIDFENMLKKPLEETTYEFFTTVCKKCNKKTLWKNVLEALHF